MRLHSIDYIRAKLAERGIELLSDYKGIEERIDCRCLCCGNEWPTRYRHITRGHGCPECGNRLVAKKKHRPEKQIVNALKERRITVLTVHREKPRTRVTFQCDDCGFEDTGSWNDLRRRGCPECGRKRGAESHRLSYDAVKSHLAQKGIQLLSTEYKNNKTKLLVRFECGCEGRINFNALEDGQRCGDCRPNARVTIEDYRALEALHRITLVDMPATASDPAEWNCRVCGPFSRPYSNMKQSGTACPHCSEGFSERICRAVAELLFCRPFKKTPLRAVRGVGGRPLHLDAYCESLKLAVEHNGTQHYRPVRFGNQTGADAAICFRKQQEHDRRRREFCQTTGITLIEVPELGRRTRMEDLKEFIRAECQKSDFKLPEGFDQVHLKLDAHHLATTTEEMWARVLSRVGELGYTLKTTNYPGANGQLLLLDSTGHEYRPRLASFLRGHKSRRDLIKQRAVPVVVLPLGAKTGTGDYASARVFDTIQDCAKTLKTNPNSVRTVAKGRGNSCNGFGIAQITPAQGKSFRESAEALIEFCRAKWPSPERYDRQDGSRKALSKPVMFSDGREFSSKSAAGRALGVSAAAVAHAVRTGKKCRGFIVRLASVVFG